MISPYLREFFGEHGGLQWEVTEQGMCDNGTCTFAALTKTSASDMLAQATFLVWRVIIGSWYSRTTAFQTIFQKKCSVLVEGCTNKNLSSAKRLKVLLLLLKQHVNGSLYIPSAEKFFRFTLNPVSTNAILVRKMTVHCNYIIRSCFCKRSGLYPYKLTKNAYAAFVLKPTLNNCNTNFPDEYDKHFPLMFDLYCHFDDACYGSKHKFFPYCFHSNPKRKGCMSWVSE